jgi:hypothetical protein
MAEPTTAAPAQPASPATPAEPAAKQDEAQLEGIGGWLLIPFFGLLIGAFDHSHTILDHELPRAATEILVMNAVLAIGSVAVFTLFCMRHSIVPMLVVVLAIGDIALHTLEYVAVTTYVAQANPELATGEEPRILEGLKTTLAFTEVNERGRV